MNEIGSRHPERCNSDPERQNTECFLTCGFCFWMLRYGIWKILRLGKLVKSMPGYLYDMVEQLGYSDVEEEWRYLNWIYGERKQILKAFKKLWKQKIVYICANI